jgi:hypothetical protein
MTGTLTRNTDPHQEPAQHRPEAGAAGEAGGPDGDGRPALLVVVEHVADQGEGRGRQRGAGHAEQGPGGDEEFGGVGVGRQDGRHAEQAGADEQDLPAAYPVAQRPHRDHGSGQQEGVDVHDPELLRAAGLQVGAQARQREEQRRHVHGDQQCGKHEHGEADPLAPAGSCSVVDHAAIIRTSYKFV